MAQARDVHPRLYRKFLVHAKKVAIREWRENRRRFGNLIRRETKKGKRNSWLYGRRKTERWQENAKGIDKGLRWGKEKKLNGRRRQKNGDLRKKK